MKLSPVHLLNEVIRLNVLIKVVVHDLGFKMIYNLVIVSSLTVLKG